MALSGESEAAGAAAGFDWRPLAVSLQVAIPATIASVAVGTGLGWLLARKCGPAARRWLGAAVLLPLALPPTVLGWYLLVVIGRRGPVGRLWEQVTGEPLVFTRSAAVVAAMVGGIPVVARQMAAAFSAQDPHLLEAARLDGAGPWSAARLVELPLARGALVAAGAVAFARALGDFGATLMVAGNLPGRTQTAALAVYEYSGAGRDADAARMVAATTAAAALLLAGLAWFDEPAPPPAGTPYREVGKDR